MTDQQAPKSGAWSFSGFGAEFDEHVAAHLPGYADVQRLIALVAEYTVPPRGTVADLGASTGRSIAEIQGALPTREIRYHLYDEDQSMLDQAADRLRDVDRVSCYRRTLPTPREAGGRLDHSGAHLTLALWLLQFVNPDERERILVQARTASSRHGAILIATKTTHADSRWQDIALGALDDYKAGQGVTAEERARKTASLRGVMQPPTVDEVKAELRNSGWVNPSVIWRWHTWAVVGAWASRRSDG